MGYLTSFNTTLVKVLCSFVRNVVLYKRVSIQLLLRFYVADLDAVFTGERFNTTLVKVLYLENLINVK